jgi:hypothetical protein
MIFTNKRRLGKKSITIELGPLGEAFGIGDSISEDSIEALNNAEGNNATNT